jgi:hypothetical protein
MLSPVLLLVAMVPLAWIPAWGAEPLLAPASSTASGYVVEELPLPADILPSCMAVQLDGTLIVGSIDGDLLRVVDPDSDGRLDRYTRGAETLHWPLSLRSEGNDVLVAMHGALLRLSDRDRDGWAERWRTLSDA